MSRYSLGKKLRRISLRSWIIIVSLIALVGVIAILAQSLYFSNLRPVSDVTKQQIISITSGSSVNQIALELQKAGLVRSSQAFVWYVSIHNERTKLQAGTYSFSPSQSTPTIAQDIADGKVATQLVTILSGQTLAQISQTFVRAGFQEAAVNASMNANLYRSSYSVLASLPLSATLEGFLWPDSYQKNANTNPGQIVGEAISEMQQHLTPSIIKGFTAHGLSVYQGVTLASIVEKEVSNQSARNQAAQVFLKRLQIGMPLGSDVTAYFGSVLAGQPPSLTYDSAYNTLIHSGLPPGPIGTVSQSALEAVAYPANTDWLYFVTGDNGTTYFSQTLQQDQANIAAYCHILCGQNP